MNRRRGERSGKAPENGKDIFTNYFRASGRNRRDSWQLHEA
jgi:hypothetical protein